MIKALKMTADRMAVPWPQVHDVEFVEHGNKYWQRAAGMIAKYLATSFGQA